MMEGILVRIVRKCTFLFVVRPCVSRICFCRIGPIILTTRMICPAVRMIILKRLIILDSFRSLHIDSR